MLFCSPMGIHLPHALSSAAVFLLGVSANGQVITGVPVSELAAFDQAVTSIMTQYNIPGAALAVTNQGRLVLAHGYGTLDPGGIEPVQPDSLFRVASLSKPITAVAILQLWDQGLIDLDRGAFHYLPDIHTIPGQPRNPQMSQITVRQLLTYCAGWDENLSPDPLNQTTLIAKQLGVTPPANSTALIRAMLSRPLDFTPGARFSYDEFAYIVLGRIVEHVTGMNYEEYIRTQILAPLGIERMRLGNTALIGRIPGEVSYQGFGAGTSVFPYLSSPQPLEYGGSAPIETDDAGSGWVASAVDLNKFWDAIDGRRGGPLLSQAALSQLAAKPNLPDWAHTAYWYGMGFVIVGNSYWWKDGVTDASRSLMVRTNSGSTWTVLFNSFGASDYSHAIDSLLRAVNANVASWPASDLYPMFVTPNTNRPSIQTQDGVLNAASLQRGFTAGSWVALRGVNLATTTESSTSLPLTLAGATVTIGGQPAAIGYASPTELHVQAPSGVPFGAVVVDVTTNGMSSGPAIGELRPHAPGLYTFTSGGATYVSATFADGTPVGDPAKLAGAVAARPGTVVTITGSNFEGSASGVQVSSAQPLSTLPLVKVGGVAASVISAVLAGTGLYQVTFTIPAVSSGDQTLSLSYAGSFAQGGLFITVGS